MLALGAQPVQPLWSCCMVRPLQVRQSVSSAGPHHMQPGANSWPPQPHLMQGEPKLAGLLGTALLKGRVRLTLLQAAQQQPGKHLVQLQLLLPASAVLLTACRGPRGAGTRAAARAAPRPGAVGQRGGRRAWA